MKIARFASVQVAVMERSKKTSLVISSAIFNPDSTSQDVSNVYVCPQVNDFWRASKRQDAWTTGPLSYHHIPQIIHIHAHPYKSCSYPSLLLPLTFHSPTAMSDNVVLPAFHPAYDRNSSDLLSGTHRATGNMGPDLEAGTIYGPTDSPPDAHGLGQDPHTSNALAGPTDWETIIPRMLGIADPSTHDALWDSGAFDSASVTYPTYSVGLRTPALVFRFSYHTLGYPL